MTRPALLLSFSRATLLAYSAFFVSAPRIISAESTASTVKLVALRCEYLEAPENIDSPAPRLSWRIESGRRGAAQSAWQIRVASSAEKLARGEADLWDSDRVAGNTTNQIAYAGRALASRAE